MSPPLPGQWTVVERGQGVEIIPAFDLIEHVFGKGCSCRPDVEYDEDRTTTIHHSADGREAFERGVRLAS